MPKMICTSQTFIAQPCQQVRWLSEDSDYEIAADFWLRRGSPLSLETWQEAIQRYRYRYAGLILENTVLATAALIPYSSLAWELGAVGTDEWHRCKGYGEQACVFVTAAILAEVPVATCTTADDNEAMIRTALSIGFRVADKADAQRYGDLIGEYFHKIETGVSA